MEKSSASTLLVFLSAMLFPVYSSAATLPLDAYNKVKNAKDCASTVGKQDLGVTFKPSPALGEFQVNLPTSLTNHGEYANTALTVRQTYPGSPTQTLPFRTAVQDLALMRCWLTVEDVNFDGYLDIAAVTDFGAKWQRKHYWVFDKRTSKYINNRLTGQLGKFTANRIGFDSHAKTVTLGFLTLDDSTTKEVYRNHGGKLTLIEDESIRYDKRTNKVTATVTVRKRIRGKMKVVATHPLD